MFRSVLSFVRVSTCCLLYRPYNPDSYFPHPFVSLVIPSYCAANRMDAFQGQCWREAPEFPASLSPLLQTPTLRQEVDDKPPNFEANVRFRVRKRF